jgi:hypothetical protein
VRKLAYVDPVRLAAGFAVVIAVFGLLGAANVITDGDVAFFDLDAEGKLPAFVAAAILLCAAVGALLACLETSERRWPWAVLAVLFSVMAVDEAFRVHEALEDETSTDWQVLYLPLMAAGAVAWFALLGRLRRLRLAALLLFAGAVMWAVAGVLESIQWTGPRETERAVEGYGILMGIEELLEMCGSACFALAPLLAVRAWLGIGTEAAPAVDPPRAPAGVGG